MASILADLVLVLHLIFIGFVALGGLPVLRWPRLAWAHLPAVSWGALIEFGGWICPLTPLENRLRTMAGKPPYDGGFIEQYVTPIIYPPGLERGHQIMIGIAIVAFNLAIYSLAVRRWRRQNNQPPKSSC